MRIESLLVECGSSSKRIQLHFHPVVPKSIHLAIGEITSHIDFWFKSYTISLGHFPRLAKFVKHLKPSIYNLQRIYLSLWSQKLSSVVVTLSLTFTWDTKILRFCANFENYIHLSLPDFLVYSFPMLFSNFMTIKLNCLSLPTKQYRFILLPTFLPRKMKNKAHAQTSLHCEAFSLLLFFLFTTWVVLQCRRCPLSMATEIWYRIICKHTLCLSVRWS